MYSFYFTSSIRSVDLATLGAVLEEFLQKVDLLPHTNIHTHSLFFCPGLVEADVRMGGRDQSMCDRAKQTPQGHHVHKSITACDIELID